MTAKDTNKSVLQEQWDGLIIPLPTQPPKGWEREFRQIARREIERLSVREDEQAHHG